NEEALNIMGHPDMGNESATNYTQSGALHTDGTPYSAEEYPLARAILTGEVSKQENMLYRRGDGRLIHLATNAAPIYDAQGQILAGIITFHDISERYELEQKKDEFIRLASHELRTPLTSLKGNLQLTARYLKRYLKDTKDLSAQEAKTLLEQLEVWNERALRQTNVENRLINDLLDASSIQAKGLRVSAEPSNLVQIVRDTVDDMQTVAEPHTLYFETPHFSEISVLVDAVRIGQVVTNYVRNALKYATIQQPVIVGITLEDHEVRVWVRDTGPGLSLEQQHSIWERFHQTASLTGYRYAGCGGLGLGLYICQELIWLHKGHTGVESTLGKGSTFWFTLPTLSRGEGAISAS
ncbi:MAG: sensor histidine kinase, partial [Ktedonobacteraceae bacterium]